MDDHFEIDIERFLAAVPHAEAAPPERRRPVAAALRTLRAELEDDGLRDQLARALYWPLFEALRADGADGRTASRLAARAARLAILLMRGYEQRQAARELDVSERTAKLDADRIRGVVREMRAAAGRDLPPVPRADGDNIRPRQLPRRQAR